MPDVLMVVMPGVLAFLGWLPAVLMMIVGFSLVVFMHELGHFAVAKLCGIRVEKFAVGFGKELFGFTKGETRYAFNALPLGGYVKMLGQEDFAVDKSGEWVVKDDPRSFTNKPVGQRMLVVSAGVAMNIVFAAFLFMIVFMIGREEMSPVIGVLIPDGPAKRAGLEMGDEILSIDGHKTEDFADIKMSVVLADPHEYLTIKYRRGDQIGELKVRPEPGRDNLLQIGFHPAAAREIHSVFPQDIVDPETDLRAGDSILEVEGAPIRDFTEVLFHMIAGRGKPVILKAERIDPENPSKRRIIEARRRLPLVLLPETAGDHDTEHLLGLVPLRKVKIVEEEGRAWLAGFKEGDVIVKWGSVSYPTYSEIHESIVSSPNKDIRVEVRRSRETEPVKLVVRPKLTRSGVFGVGPPSVEMSYDETDDGELIVGSVLKTVGGRSTPAAALGLSRGDRILKVNEKPVNTWYELIDVFFAKAGTTVQLTYRTADGRERTEPMSVPHSVETLVKLPPAAKIVSIGGEREIMIEGGDGQKKRHVASDWRGARALLAKHVGQKVEILYRDLVDLSNPREGKAVISVTEEMIDPWVGRIFYGDPGLLPLPLVKTIQTSNPAHAMRIGIKKTYYFLAHVYLTMKRIVFSQTVGIEHISGPVGIIKMGAAIMDSGFVRMLYFLGIISANLAVINFLPLPIVDGGLMVFLIIEKIKGKPVSLKTQVVTQIIGLALIIATFVFVTYLDLTKL